MPRLSQKFVASIGPVQKDSFFWDDELKGFFVRAWPGSRPVWGIRYLHEGKKRTVVIGPCHEVKAERARDRATEIKQSARLGRDILAEKRELATAPTIADLAREHQEMHKPPIISQDTWNDRKTHWERHIIPTIGKTRVRDLTATDIKKFHLSYSAQPSLANRLLATLAKALTDCLSFGPPWRSDNPAARIAKFEENKRQRILSNDEIHRVLHKLEELKRSNALHASAFWLFHALMISGLRLSELAERKWKEIDLEKGTLFIPKAKNKKPRTVTLSADMIQLLAEIPRRSEFVFPSSSDKPFAYPQKHWDKVRKECGIEDVRLHDLRHTCASYAMHVGGLSQREVMELLGHSQMSTTERYLNVHDENRKSIADRASVAIASLKEGQLRP